MEMKLFRHEWDIYAQPQAVQDEWYYDAVCAEIVLRYTVLWRDAVTAVEAYGLKTRLQRERDEVWRMEPYEHAREICKKGLVPHWEDPWTLA